MNSWPNTLDYQIIDLNEENIDTYDLFCFKSKKKSEGYRNKVKWVKKRFKEGIRLKILYVNEGPKRGFTSRGFIEYIPGEYTWRGIDAQGWMVIHCIWVVGKHKKKGYGTKLLEECINDSKKLEMNGVAVITSEKSWYPGRKLFVKNGFEKVGSYLNHIELYIKRFKDNVTLPKFIHVSNGKINNYSEGLVVFKSDQCPYLNDLVVYVGKIAKQRNIPILVENIQNHHMAQNCVHPYGTFCLLLKGKQLPKEPDTKKLFKVLTERGIIKL
ncbi:MAG: GNAT family N-acetyltransferase [Promethearchaeota archaeon]